MKLTIKITAYGNTGLSNVNDLEDAVKEAIRLYCEPVIKVYRDYDVSDMLRIESVNTVARE